MGETISKCYNNCFKISHFERKVGSIINAIDLDDFQKKIIFKRYVRQVALYEKRTRNFGVTYNTFRTAVTVGSIMIPALLSIQNDEEHGNNIYWTTWGISILITICNGCITLYSLDKNYIVFSMIVQKLKTEGWKFFESAGKYKDKTHKENFVFFCENVEKLKMKQVNKEIEFIAQQGGDKSATDDNDSLFYSLEHKPPKSDDHLLHVNHQPNTLENIKDIANLKIVVDKINKNHNENLENKELVNEEFADEEFNGAVEILKNKGMNKSISTSILNTEV